MTSEFKPVRDRKNTHEKIADQIKDAIFKKRYLPGQRLPSERDLVIAFNTSRVTLRQAILTLKNSGLLYIKIGTGGGTFVSEDIGESEITDLVENIIKWKSISIHDVIQMREIIEPQIAYLAAKEGSPQKTELIWNAINELEDAFQVREKFKSEDERFHKALADAAGNPILAIFQASIIDILFKFIHKISWKAEDKDNMLNHHRKIAERVEAKDAIGAKQAMIAHLEDMNVLLSKLPVDDVLKWID